MNQILQIKRKDSKNKSENIKEVILYWLVVAIIFGFIFGGYLIVKNIVYLSHDGNTIQIPEYIPTIVLEKNDADKLVIRIESEIGISNIKYNWNGESQQVIELEGKTNIEKIIDIPIGENTIYMSVIDINGKQTNKEETFVIEVSKPEIELAIVGNYIKITVTSEKELSEITYQWNSETIKKENMLTYENRNQFEKKVEIPIGQNTLKVVAIDVDEVKTEKIQEIKGITKATTTTEVKDGYWHFTVIGKENIKKVEFEFNGKKYLMNETTFGETKKVHYKVKLLPGTNYLKITSTTMSDGIDTTQWNKEYTE